MINIIVENIYCQISDLSQDLIKELDLILSYKVLGAEFTSAYSKGWWDSRSGKWERWDGKNHLLKNGTKFHTGLLDRVTDLLKSRGVEFVIIDNRKIPHFNEPIETKNIEIREYQDRALQAALQNNTGILRIATGGGKSVLISRIISNTNLKSIVYVVGVDLLYQMKEMFEKVLKTKVGIIGDGKVEVHRINICSVWTAVTALGKKYVPMDDEEYSKKEKIHEINKSKIAKIIKESEMVFFDECHMLATDTLQTINNASKSAYYKYGLSGTIHREDNADMLLESVCGKVIIDITATELIKDGFLVPPIIHFINVPPIENLPDKYPSIYKEFIVENDLRNEKIVKAAEKLISAGRKTLILVKNIKHGEILLDELEKKFVVYFVRGDLDSEERNRIRNDFMKNKIDIIIASSVYDQGVDLPNLDSLILAGSGKSSGRALQRLGRVIRPYKGKKNSIVVDFIDNAKYLLEHTAKRIAIYRTETGFQIKLPERKDTDNNGTSEKKKKTIRRVQTNNSGNKMSW